MKKLFLLILMPMLGVALACLAGSAVALAGDCTPTVYAGSPYSYPPMVRHDLEVVDQPVRRIRTVVDVIQVLQINPSYVSAYSPSNYDSVTQAELLNELRRLGLRVDQMAGQVQVLTNRPVPPVPPVLPPSTGTPPAPLLPPVDAPPKKPDAPEPGPSPTDYGVGLAVMNVSCAKCHMAGSLKPTGQTFALLDAKGNLNTLTDTQKLRIIERVLDKEMPPPGNTVGAAPLTLVEKFAILSTLRKR